MTQTVPFPRSAPLYLAVTAARATRFLGPAAADVLDFIRAQQLPGGGYPDRGGQPDIYYTQFALQSLVALDAHQPLPAPFVEQTLHDLAQLDLVHSASLAIAAALTTPATAPQRQALLHHIESFRAADGAWATLPGADFGSPYGTFLAMQGLEALGHPTPSLPDFTGFACSHGGYVNQPGSPETSATVTATAAAVACLWTAHREIPSATAPWLTDLFAPHIGGFRVAPNIAVPDLLSTAVALFALDLIGADLTPFREPTLSLIESLWDDSGGFCGHPVDPKPDLEYTWYALLALGCLGGVPSAQ